MEDAVEWSFANPSPNAVRFYPDEDATFFQDTGQNHLEVVRRTGIDTVISVDECGTSVSSCS